MPELYKVGLFALPCVATVAGLIAWIGGLVWYAAYFVKLRIRGLRDTPLQIMAILTVVSLAMILFTLL